MQPLRYLFPWMVASTAVLGVAFHAWWLCLLISDVDDSGPLSFNARLFQTISFSLLWSWLVQARRTNR